MGFVDPGSVTASVDAGAKAARIQNRPGRRHAAGRGARRVRAGGVRATLNERPVGSVFAPKAIDGKRRHAATCLERVAAVGSLSHNPA